MNLLNDLWLLRHSDIFNELYYLAYHPEVKKFKINPYLHYLIIGGFAGLDPGPNFDSSWYLKTYEEARKSGLNPLIHYLKHGTKEDTRTFSKDGGKHIEFIGINGSGKTSLYHQVNDYLKQQLGYKPGPEKTWSGIIDDVRIRALGKGAYSCLIDFLGENKEFIVDILTANIKKINEPGLIPEFQNMVMRYFFAVSSTFQAVKSDHAKPWFMIDEGFCILLADYIVDDSGKFVSDLSEKLLTNMPKPDLLIHVKTDIDTCVNRLRTGRGKIPKPYRALSEAELMNLLFKWDKIYSNFVNVIEKSQTKVVLIDNNKPLDESTKELIPIIQSIL